jgi:hypothetical protein
MRARVDLKSPGGFEPAPAAAAVPAANDTADAGWVAGKVEVGANVLGWKERVGCSRGVGTGACGRADDEDEDGDEGTIGDARPSSS